jgi:hypothetical protein
MSLFKQTWKVKLWSEAPIYSGKNTQNVLNILMAGETESKSKKTQFDSYNSLNLGRQRCYWSND